MKISKILACTLMLLAGNSFAFSQIDLGKIINSGIQTVQNATASTKFEASDLVGTWTYTSPAVAFKSDNALSNIGGAAAATAVENKLVPYFQKAGLQNSQLIVNKDLTFTWKLGAVTLSGTIEKDATSNLVFNFSAFNKVKIGKVDCIATKSGSTVNLTFDAGKILAIAQKISSLSNNSTFKTLNSLLDNYKDMYIGAKMKRATK